MMNTLITAVLSVIAQASNRFETGFPCCELIYSSRVGDGAKRLLAVVPPARPLVGREPLLTG